MIQKSFSGSHTRGDGSQEIRTRWLARAEEWGKLGVQVDGARVAKEVLDDIEAITHDERFTKLSLVDASKESGYSAHALGQMVKRGTIPNAGRPNAPKILRKDLPKKPGFLQREEIPSISRERIARAVANSTRSSDG